MRTAILSSILLSLALVALGCESRPSPAPAPSASGPGVLDQIKARAAERAAAKLDGGAADAGGK